MDEDLETPNNNVDDALKQNSTQKKINLLEPGQAIKYKLTNNIK